VDGAGAAEGTGSAGCDAAGVAGAVEAGAGVLDLLACAGVAGLAAVVGLPVCAGYASGASAKNSSAAAMTKCFEGMATM
jgi:hypothetical protein